jgi:hypothetical protein
VCKRIARILILCLSVVLTPLTLGHAQEAIDSVKIDRAHKILRDAYDTVRKNYYDRWSQWVDATLRSNPTCIENQG